MQDLQASEVKSLQDGEYNTFRFYLYFWLINSPNVDSVTIVLTDVIIIVNGLITALDDVTIRLSSLSSPQQYVKFGHG